MLFALFALLSAPVTAQTSPPCPNTGLAEAPVTFTTGKGRFSYRLEIAATPDQQQCGLMYRKAMPRNIGMDFPFDVARPASFWMENTVLPLDIVFVDSANRVIGIGHGVPYARTLIDSGLPAKRVIELNAGEAKRIGLKPGDAVSG